MRFFFRPFFLFAVLGIIVGAHPAAAQFRVVAYVPTWSAVYPANVASLDLAKITHLNIAFANPDATGALIPTDHTDADVARVAAAGHARGVKVLLSIGGASASGAAYHSLITSDLSGFVQSIVGYCTTAGLDGIDVDIEGNILDGATLTAQQYEDFVTQLGASLHAQGKLMTCALAAWFAQYVTITATRQFDFISSMSYDATGPWAPQTPGQHSPYSMAVNDFQFWNGTKGVAASALNVGVPFYGYGFGTHANQGISYADIVNTYPGAENTDQIDTGANGIYYNGIPTIGKKTTYALQHAGGIMMWELTQDCTDRRSLLRAIDSVIALQHPATPVLLRPANGATNQPMVDTLVWGEIPNAIQYELQCAVTAGFAMPIVDDTSLTQTVRIIAGLAESTTYFWRVRGFTAVAAGPWSAVSAFTTQSLTAVGDANANVPEFRFLSITPAPVRDEATITVDATTPVTVQVRIVDVLGRQVAAVLSEAHLKGRTAISWRATELPTGMYSVEFSANGTTRTQRVMVVR